MFQKIGSREKDTMLYLYATRHASIFDSFYCILKAGMRQSWDVWCSRSPHEELYFSYLIVNMHIFEV